jgi:hypothetical protein
MMRSEGDQDKVDIRLGSDSAKASYECPKRKGRQKTDLGWD